MHHSHSTNTNNIPEQILLCESSSQVCTEYLIKAVIFLEKGLYYLLGIIPADLTAIIENDADLNRALNIVIFMSNDCHLE